MYLQTHFELIPLSLPQLEREAYVADGITVLSTKVAMMLQLLTELLLGGTL